MSLESDLLLDRRRLKRRLLFWRLLAVLAVVGCAALGLGLGRGGWLPQRPHLVRLTVAGIITDQRKLAQSVAALADDDSVKALIVSVDSPGGSVAGGENLHDAIAAVAAKKPVVAVMRGVAASAGYMVALPAARIFAHESTLTGSIGVLLPTVEASGLLHSLGITAEAITSGPLKDQPSFTRPLSPQGREVLQGLVMDMYDQFVAMVAAGRHMDPARVRELGDGRAYTGRQALALGLIDAIGGEREAREWLARERGVAAALPVQDLQPRGLAAQMLGQGLGLMVQDVLKRISSHGLILDGGWALWQPGQGGG
jgi:protease-4